MIVCIEHVHNHPVTGNPKVMQHRDVSEETIQKFKDLFAGGQTPASALKMHKLNLHMKHTTNYKYLSSDRLVCPDLSFVYRLYAKVFKKRDGADSENSVIPEELTTLKMRFHNFVASVEKQLNENKNECAPAVEAFFIKLGED
ncbi:uncharacterized protein LOC112559869 [Pomacea canaliculata]|uniref:uncharacterized protein LOC112559869 n=1 Tax=Pomacea canaliculata TaxID=400727 RepID=UPI000D72560B|nr:uncharacterized protein LOC112559869 [Pomacea canaliculata]